MACVKCILAPVNLLCHTLPCSLCKNQMLALYLHLVWAMCITGATTQSTAGSFMFFIYLSKMAVHQLQLGDGCRQQDVLVAGGPC